jgi:hypothetical protein
MGSSRRWTRAGSSPALSAACRVSARASALRDAGTVTTTSARRGSRPAWPSRVRATRRSSIVPVTSTGVRHPGTAERG